MSEWKKVKIGDICKIVKGTAGIASAEPGQYPLVVTAEERKTCSTYQFDCEAVCIPLVSSSGHGKKSLKNVHYQSGKFALGTILCAVIPNNPQELDARYLHQYLQFYKDIILVPLMKGAANVSLSMKDILAVEFPLPPIERQRELSNLFVSLQEKQKELSAEYEKQTEYAKLLRQNILQEAIEGKLTADWRKKNPVQKGNPDYDAEALFEQIQKGEVRSKLRADALVANTPSLKPASQFSATPSPRGKAPKTPDNFREFFKEKLDSERNRTNNARSKLLAPITDEEKSFEIPEGWKWVRLGEISNKIEAGKSILCNDKIPSNDEIGIVKTGVCSFGKFKENESKTCLSKNDWHDEYEIKKGDFLIGRANTLELVGSCVIVDSINKKLMLSDKILRIVFCNFVNLFFILYMMKSKFLRSQIEKSSTGSSPTMKNISQESIKNYILPLPPLKEQEEIVNKVETLLAKVTTLENQIQERKSLSDKLIFGIIKENLEAVKK